MKTSLNLPDDLVKRAKIRAIQDGTTFRQLVIAAVTAYLKVRPERKGD